MILMFLSILFITLMPHWTLASASCQQNVQLTVAKRTVQHKGYQFEKTEVNRTVPVDVVYRVVTNDRKVSSVVWEHDDKVVKVDEGSDGEFYYAIEENPSGLNIRLHIGLPSPRTTGEWIMTVKTSDGLEHSAVCIVEAPPILQLNRMATRVNEGDPVALSCELESFSPSTQVEWKRFIDSGDGSQLAPVENAKFKSENNVQDARIEWQDTNHVGGFYLCTARSPYGSDNAIFEVRIKNLGTYLWPSIGILLELVVLAITIIVYERSQAKKRKAEAARSLNEGDGKEK